MGALICAVLVIFPLVITPGFLFYFDLTPKVVCLLLGASAGAVWLGTKGRLSRLMGFRAGRWLAVLFAAQVLSLAASTAASGNWWLSISGTNWRRLGVVTYVATLVFALATAACLVERPQSLRGMRRASVASGIVAALYGILQYSGWDPWLPAWAYHVGEGVTAIVRPPGTLGYANYFAAYLLFVAFAGIWTVFEEDGRVWRALGLVAAATASVGIVVSGTRAAMLGLVAGALIFAVLMRVRLPLRPVCVALAVLIAGCVAVYWSPWGGQLRNRARWSAEEPLGGARLLLWRDSLSMAASRPVLGYGPESFSAEFPRFQSRALARAYPDFYYESPHNMFLDALVSQGFLGFALLLCACALGGYAAHQARRRAPVAVAALVSALAAACISQQFTVFVASTGLFFYFVIAALVALDGPPTPASPAPNRRLGLACGLAVSAALLLCAVRYWQADYALARCSRAFDGGKLDQAMNDYERARHWQLPGAASDLWYSRRLAQSAQASPVLWLRLTGWRQAMEAAARAVRTAEDPHNAWYNLAAFYAAQNDIADTLTCLRSAAAWAPNWFKPHWMLAKTLQAAGQLGDAEREAVLAADLNAGKDPEVALTLSQIRSAAGRR